MKPNIPPLAVFCLLAISLLQARPAYAIPAFARREGMMCQSCHFRMPELNEDGHAYMRRGLREDPRGATGDMAGMSGTEPNTPAAETRRPHGVPTPMNWADYMSVMGHSEFVAQKGMEAAFDAGMLDLWIAGPIGPLWSGLANPFFDIQNGGADVDQAYGQYITRWAERFGSARFGQDLPFAILFNQGGPSMTLSAPVALSMPGDSGSGWTPTSLIRGAEVGIIDLPHWNVYLGLGNSQANTAPSFAQVRLGRQPQSSTGDPSHLDFYASGEYLFGNHGDSLTLYGYWGKSDLSPAVERPFRRIGVFANIYGPSTKGVLGYLTGNDDAVDGSSLRNDGYFLLAEQLLSDRWAAYARYDWFRRDLVSGEPQTMNGPALGISWWAETQIRLTLEAQFLNTVGQSSDSLYAIEFLWAL